MPVLQLDTTAYTDHVQRPGQPGVVSDQKESFWWVVHM